MPADSVSILILILILIAIPIRTRPIKIKIKIRIGIPARRTFPLFTLLLLTPGAARAQTTLQIDAGLDAQARAGRWMPVRVTATNNGPPVAGQLELTAPGDRVSLPLELPSTAKKEVQALLLVQPDYTPYGTSSDSAQGSLREGRREVAAGQARLNLLPETSRLLVVCGEPAGMSGAGVRFLDGMRLGDVQWLVPREQQSLSQNGQVATAHLTPAQMPVVGAGLDAADMLVIPDTAWRQLEPAQRQAVRQWVEMGGRLLLCGEDPNGFSDGDARHLLPVTLASPRPRPELTAFPLPDRQPIRAAAGQVMTVAATPKPGAFVALQEAGEPIAAGRPAGFGGVVWLGFDPFRIPPSGRAGRTAFWAFLIGQVTGMTVSPPAFPGLKDLDQRAIQPLSRLPHFPAPGRWTLAGFGAAYVLIFGPGNLWLLRRLRRTVRAWLVMPGLSLALTAGVLAVGTRWGRARVVYRTLSVLEAMAGSRTAREQDFAALFSPANRAFSLEIEDPAPVVRFLPAEGEDGSIEPQRYTRSSFPGAPAAEGRSIITPDEREGDLCRWSRIGVTLWTIQLFQVERAVDLAGGVQIELDDRLAGRVVNQTSQPLREAYLQLHAWRQPLGDLAPGAARTVTTQGWRRQRLVDTTGSEYRPLVPGTTHGSSSSPGGSVSEEASADDLFNLAGRLLIGGPEQAEVVLVARTGSPAPPHIPGVAPMPVEGLPEGGMLVVRQPVPGPAAAMLEGQR